VAAHLAGVMSLPDALAVVAARGRLMQQQVAGRMSAVPLGANDVQRWLEPGVEVAAINAPGLCTVAGPAAAIEVLVARLKKAGIEARLLRTSHAFHSEMMAPALPAFRAVLERVALTPPQRPFISNVSGTWITPQQATSPAYWADHLRRPVQFEAGLRTLAADATLLLLEVGPGQGLAALARHNLGAVPPADAARRVVASMRRPSDTRPDVAAWLEAQARLWLAGCAIDWHHDSRSAQPAATATATAIAAGAAPARRRVPLPTYPFERQRYAVDPAVPPASNVASAKAHAGTPESLVRRSGEVDEWFYAPTWSRDDTVPATPPAAAGGRPCWLVLGRRDDALTSAVIEELGCRGFTVLRADAGERFECVGPGHWQVRIDAGDDLRRFIDSVWRTPPAGIVHLWALPTDGADRPDRLEPAAVWPLAPAEPAYDGLVALALALPDLPAGTHVRLLHVTAGAESVLGEPVKSVRQALSAGPTLVLPREIAGLQMRIVDLGNEDLAFARAPRCAATLADEVQLDALEPQVARRAGLRWVRRYERLSLPALPAGAAGLPTPPLRRRGCYLITGGLGGMGLAIARWLGKGLAARLVLTSRRALPARDDWDAWIAAHDADDAVSHAMHVVREIEAEGGEVLLAAADAADEAAMDRALQAARTRFGGIDGVFHAAGIAGRGSVARRSNASEARAVLAPKLGGLQVLCRLLGRDPLDFVVLVSSISAALPAPGVCDYAAANAVLDSFVDSSACPAAWQRVVAVDWGAWREVGMAARLSVPEDLRAHWQAHLAGAIAPADGLQALGRVLASGRRRVVVETYDVVRSHELLRRPPSALVAAAPPHSQGEAAGPSAVGMGLPGAGGAKGAGSGGVAATRPALSTSYVAPATDVEHRLAVIWEELLGVRGIGVHDDFFELGGHSLMFTRVLALVDEGFGTQLPLREVFDATTIRLLAERLPGPPPADAASSHAPAEGTAPREVLEL
jgi:malonyl CoA-acyl carrier protein transacylase